MHAEVVCSAGVPEPIAWKVVPSSEVRVTETGTGDPRLRTVVGGWMFDDGLLRVHLQRNGALRGVWRREGGEWRKLCGTLYFKAEGEKTYDQASDVEPFATLLRDDDGTLRLSFEGEIRNLTRSGKMPHGTSYRTVYSLGGANGLVLETSFKTDPAAAKAETVLLVESASDDVEMATVGEVEPRRKKEGDCESITWDGAPGHSAGAIISFPSATGT